MRNCASEVWSFGPSRNDEFWIASSLRYADRSADLPDGQISERSGDLPLSSPICKNILLHGLVETALSIPLSRPTKGAFRDRHKRGTGCGGR